MESSKQNSQIPATPNVAPVPAPDYGVNLNKILIVDDLESNRRLTSLMFRNMEFEICEADGAQSALKMMREEKPFLVLSDIRMVGMTGYELCGMIKRDPETAHIAVIFLTAHDRSPEQVAQGLDIGADDYLYRPFEREELLARVHVVARHKKIEADARYQMRVLEQRNRELERQLTLTTPPTLNVSPSIASEPAANPQKILIVDDLAPNRRLTSLMFRGTEFETSEAESAHAALGMVREVNPFLVLSDIQMPDMNGYELCEALKSDPETKHIAVIFMTAFDRSAVHTARGLELGADDYIPKPFEREELIARVRVAARLKKAETDALHQMNLAQQHNRDLILLNKVSQEISTLDTERVLNNTTRLVQETLKAEIGSLWLLDDDRQSLVIEATFGPDAQKARGVTIPVDEASIAGRVVRNGEAYFSEDVLLDEKHNRSLDGDFVTRSMLCVPLRGNKGIMGVLQALHSQPAMFSQSDLKLFQSVASSVSIAVDNANLYEELNKYKEQLEDRVAERTHELEQEKDRTLAILANMADALIEIDNTGNIRTANPVARTMLNRLSEVVGGPIPPEFLNDKLWDAVNTLTRKKEAYTIAVDVDVDDPQHPEGVLSVEARSSKMVDENGDWMGTVIVLRDLTELKTVERMKARFMSGVTHELKTPLAVIRLHAGNLSKYYKRMPDNKRNESLKAIENHVGRLDDLIAQILDLARFDSGKTLQRQNEDLIPVIEQVLKDLQPLADQKHLKLIWQKPRSPLMTDIDVEKMYSAVRNLVENAIKYTLKGAVQVEALADKVDENPVIVLRVSDTGIGIPPEYVGNGTQSARIFERFVRVDSAHTIPGTGLGLSIVKEIIHAHGGTIKVSSEVGKGSVFVVTLTAHSAR